MQYPFLARPPAWISNPFEIRLQADTILAHGKSLYIVESLEPIDSSARLFQIHSFKADQIRYSPRITMQQPNGKEKSGCSDLQSLICSLQTISLDLQRIANRLGGLSKQHSCVYTSTARPSRLFIPLGTFQPVGDVQIHYGCRTKKQLACTTLHKCSKTAAQCHSRYLMLYFSNFALFTYVCFGTHHFGPANWNHSGTSFACCDHHPKLFIRYRYEVPSFVADS